MPATGGGESARSPGERTLRARWSGPATWATLTIVAFAVNLGWEYAQFPLYGEPGQEHVLPWWIFVRASAADAVFIAAATGPALLARRLGRAGFWVVLTAVLGAVAAGIELHAQATGRWSYAPAMPTVGPIGLSPLVQLPLLGVITNVAVRPWRAHRPWAGPGGPEAGPGTERRSGGAPVPDQTPDRQEGGQGGGRRRVAAVLFSPLTRLTVLGVVVIGAAAAFALVGDFGRAGIQDAVRQAGPAAPIAFLALYGALTVVMFPGAVLTLAAGVLFGPALGTVLAVAGASLGASLAYLVGRRLGREQVVKLAGGRERIGRIDAWLGRHGFVAVLYARLIPAVPFNVLNYAAGVTSIRFRPYMLATVVGMIPGAFAYAGLGGSFQDPLSPVFLSAVSLIAVLLFAGPFVNRWLRARGLLQDGESPAESAGGQRAQQVASRGAAGEAAPPPSSSARPSGSER